MSATDDGKTIEQIVEEFDREMREEIQQQLYCNEEIKDDGEEIIEIDTEKCNKTEPDSSRTDIEVIDITSIPSTPTTISEKEPEEPESPILAWSPIRSPSKLTEMENWKYRDYHGLDHWDEIIPETQQSVENMEKEMEKENEEEYELPTQYDIPLEEAILLTRKGSKREQEEIEEHNKRAKNLLQDMWLLCHTDSEVSDIEDSHVSSQQTSDTTQEERADLEIAREEERNDPERDYEWENGLAQRVPNPYQRRRWWKYTGHVPDSMMNEPYDDQVQWIVEHIFNKIKSMTGLNFVVLGIEVCPETGRVHWHALLYFDVDKCFNTLHKMLPGQWQWLEPTRGNRVSQAIINWYKYVIKERTKLNTGREIQKWEREPGTIDRLMKEKKKRTFSEQLDDNYDNIMARDWHNVERDFLFQHAGQITNYLKMVRKPAITQNHDKLVFLWGPTRVGKSSLFKQWLSRKVCYLKNRDYKWFDGYIDQPIIVVDEMKPNIFCSDYMNWNEWGDRQPSTVEIKNGSVELGNEWMIVISNYSLEELCTKRGKFDRVLYDTFKSRCGDRETGTFRIAKIHGIRNGETIISEYDHNNPKEVKRMLRRLFGPWFRDIIKYYPPEVKYAENM